LLQKEAATLVEFVVQIDLNQSKENPVEHIFIDTGTIPPHVNVKDMSMEAAMKERIASIQLKIVSRPVSKMMFVSWTLMVESVISSMKPNGFSTRPHSFVNPSNTEAVSAMKIISHLKTYVKQNV
jgi:hypothetical protein